MDNKNNIINQENKQQASQKRNSHVGGSGVYLRDDHCDWGSSGMNEFTNEFGIDN